MVTPSAQFSQSISIPSANRTENEIANVAATGRQDEQQGLPQNVFPAKIHARWSSGIA